MAKEEVSMEVTSHLRAAWCRGGCRFVIEPGGVGVGVGASSYVPGRAGQWEHLPGTGNEGACM